MYLKENNKKKYTVVMRLCKIMEYKITELLFVNFVKIDCIQCCENTNILITKNFMSFFYLLSFEKSILKWVSVGL